MENKKPFYVLWGCYYNEMTELYVEKMLGCYKTQERAYSMAATLSEMERGKTYYKVEEEYFCDE